MKDMLLQSRGISLLSAVLVSFSPVALHAADGTWANTSSGPNNWSDPLLWSGGIIANGSVLTIGDGVTAGFSTLNKLTGSEISVTLTGANRLVKTGGGRLWLTGANTYAGGPINSFYLGVNSDAALGAVPESFVADNIIPNGGTLSNYTGSHVDVTLNANRGIYLSGNGTLLSSGSKTLTVNGIISGAGNLNRSTGGVVTLSVIPEPHLATLLGSLGVFAPVRRRQPL